MNGATYLIALSIALVVSAQEPRKLSGPPKIDHILVEVADLEKSIAFYRDFLGLEIKSQSKNFAMLESGKRPTNTRPGWGMYPHFAVADVAATVERARKAGYRIAQEPRKYSCGTEAFIADPDGYVWALINSPK